MPEVRGVPSAKGKAAMSPPPAGSSANATMNTFTRAASFLLAVAAIGCFSSAGSHRPRQWKSTRSGQRLPLVFEANRGQAPRKFEFVTRNADFSLALAKGLEIYCFADSQRR